MFARKWKRFRSQSDDGDAKLVLPTRDDFQPIDTQEQEDLVRSFERIQSQQSLLWRRVFAFLMSCYVVFLLFSIYQQAWYPWELRYYAYFMGEVDSWIVIAADWVAVLVCSITISGMLLDSQKHRRSLWYAFCVAVLPTVFWLYHMLRLSKFRWDIIWLPFAPLGGTGVCLYVNHLLNDSSEDVRKLRGYMYAYKAS